MAAVANMGEVDEIHSKEENVKDGLNVNGDLNDYADDSEELNHLDKKTVADTEKDNEPMEVDEEVTSENEIKDNETNGSFDGPRIVDVYHDEEGEENSQDVEECSVVEDSEDEESQEQIDSLVLDDNSDEEEKNLSTENNDKDVQRNGVNISDSSDKENVVCDLVDKSGDKTIILNDSGEGDVVIIDHKDGTRENGDDVENLFDESEERGDDLKQLSDDDVIELDTPTKKKKKLELAEGPPRRSSRNVNRQRKSYIEDEEKEEENADDDDDDDDESVAAAEESDIEEVMPEDPLAVADPLLNDRGQGHYKKSRMSSATIVVKDTKRLVEIASKSSPSSTGKKEPTLVIIDTNSILSGRGPVPIAQKPAISNSYSMLPMALPAQGVYPANMRATITPIPMTHSVPKPTPPPTPISQQSQVPIIPIVSQPVIPPPPPILPTLTDDMFVVEAPSFIVPYVYEKPPIKDLKEYIKDVRELAIKQRDEEAKEREEAEKRENEEGKGESKDENSGAEDEEEDKVDKSRRDKEKMDVSDISETKNDSKIDEDKDSKETEEKPSTEDKKSKQQDKETAEKKSEDKVDVKSNDVEIVSSSINSEETNEPKKPLTYFDSALGKFFTEIGFSLVQEFVQTDLLKQQKRKRDREGGQNMDTNKTISALLKNLEYTKENNGPYKMETKKCEFCSFKTESALAMAFHLETPHMKNYVYRCNFCPYEVRSPHDILFHMEVAHGVRGRLERAPAFHQCPSCPFEDNQKGKLSRHLVACARKFKPDRNMEPPGDWEPPAKIPRVPRMKQQGLNATAAVYQAMARSHYNMLPKTAQAGLPVMHRGRGRPSLGTPKPQPVVRNSTSMFYKQGMSGGSVLVPTNYQLSGNQLYQQQQLQSAMNKIKPMQQPSISITPLPRGSSVSVAPVSKPGDSSSKNSFVICEICDGYIKDLEQLRNHMQWIHKVKIHPKMIYNRPPLNCQKCQFRFFTDQGLERHLLGSHGLVTSSMQEAANKSKDSGRCPVCGRVYQWKLLNHVARDHNMTLKPAHLSYKCTVCTATFGMYKQFENHVYSAHSVVAKRVMDKKSSAPPSSVSKNDSLLKPLKINDEITIIPQPAKTNNGPSTSREDNAPSTSGASSSRNNFGNRGGSDFNNRTDRLSRRKLQVDN